MYDYTSWWETHAAHQIRTLEDLQAAYVEMLVRHAELGTPCTGCVAFAEALVAIQQSHFAGAVVQHKQLEEGQEELARLNLPMAQARGMPPVSLTVLKERYAEVLAHYQLLQTQYRGLEHAYLRLLQTSTGASLQKGIHDGRHDQY